MCRKLSEFTRELSAETRRPSESCDEIPLMRATAPTVLFVAIRVPAGVSISGLQLARYETCPSAEASSVPEPLATAPPPRRLILDPHNMKC
jgi:hypothetical protein